MSGRGTHHAGGAVAGLTAGGGALLAGASVREVVVLAVTAAITGGGMLSPDVDQYRAWRTLDRWLPDELLGVGGPLQHRGISHWWGTMVGLAALWAGLLVNVPTVHWLWPVAAGQVAGWASHLALDFVYGAQVRARSGPIVVRGGVPLAPWWMHVGIRWRSGGLGSRFAGVVLTGVAVAEAALLIRWAGAPPAAPAVHLPFVHAVTASAGTTPGP